MPHRILPVGTTNALLETLVWITAIGLGWAITPFILAGFAVLVFAFGRDFWFNYTCKQSPALAHTDFKVWARNFKLRVLLPDAVRVIWELITILILLILFVKYGMQGAIQL